MAGKTVTGKKRIFILIGVVVFICAVYFVRLIQLQVVDGDMYLAKVQQGTVKLQSIPAARGEILDRNGKPLAVNRTCFDVVLNKAYLAGNNENETILKILAVLKDNGVTWTDALPISAAQPYAYVSGADADVSKLKSTLKLEDYATAENAMYWLKDRYKLAGYSEADARTLASIRYQMELAGYSMSVPYVIATDIDTVIMVKLKEKALFLPGLDIQTSSVREYPYPTLLPHLLGIVGPLNAGQYETLKDQGYAYNDVIGQSGVEKAFESELRGTDGTREIRLDADGKVISTQVTKAPVSGHTVVLTIDADMQRAATQSLVSEIELLNRTGRPGLGKEANAGAVVATDIKTGEILACVTYPSFDISTYRQDYAALNADPLQPIFNRALQGTYAVGSTFKPCVATGALAEGVITPETTVNCNHVYTFFPDYQPKCEGWHGATNVIKALTVSCNIFFYDTGRRLGIQNIDKYATLYGLGQPTGIESPESVGAVSSEELGIKLHGVWHPGDVLQAAIGQMDNRFTPLQLNNYAATIARRGVREETHIVKSIMSYNLDQTIKVTEPVVASTMSGVPDDVFSTVIQGMTAASKPPSGTSRRVFGSYPLPVASKTGTPQTAQFPNSTYIAFCPADDPQIAVSVFIEMGGEGTSGAPVARGVFDYYFFDKGKDTTTPPDWRQQIISVDKTDPFWGQVQIQ